MWCLLDLLATRVAEENQLTSGWKLEGVHMLWTVTEVACFHQGTLARTHGKNNTQNMKKIMIFQVLISNLFILALGRRSSSQQWTFIIEIVHNLCWLALLLGRVTLLGCTSHLLRHNIVFPVLAASTQVSRDCSRVSQPLVLLRVLQFHVLVCKACDWMRGGGRN